MMEIKRATG